MNNLNSELAWRDAPDQHIRGLVAGWPELSPTQAKRIAALLRSSQQETPAVKDEWDV